MNRNDLKKRALRDPLSLRALRWLGWGALLGAIYAVQRSRAGQPVQLPAPVSGVLDKIAARWNALKLAFRHKPDQTQMREQEAQHHGDV